MGDIDIFLMVLVIISFTLFVGEHFTSKKLRKQLEFEYLEKAKYKAFYYLNMEVAQKLEKELSTLQEKFESLEDQTFEAHRNLKNLSKND